MSTVFPPSLEGCIEKYQVTKDENEFHQILAYLDNLLLRMIHQERRRWNALEEVEMQELYHIAVICLHAAVLKYDKAKSSIYSLPRMIQGYMRNEYAKIIRDRLRYDYRGMDATPFECQDNRYYNSIKHKKGMMLRIDVEDMLNRLVKGGKLKEQDGQMFMMVHMEGRSYWETAQTYGGTEAGIKQRIFRTTKMLRSLIK